MQVFSQTQSINLSLKTKQWVIFGEILARSFFMLLFLMFSLSSVALFANVTSEKEEITIQLNTPEYSGKVMQTENGGVLETKGFRIQAKNIMYFHKTEDKARSIVASGDLLIQYEGNNFVGDKITYDFDTKSGVILGGRTQVDATVIASDSILLHPDRSFSITKGYITSSEDDQVIWKLLARSTSISKNKELKSEDIFFYFADIPIFYLPYYKSNLGKSTESPFRYGVNWESGQGPKLSMRYRVYSSETTGVFTRLDYRINRGFGGAFESIFESKNKHIGLQTKNYVAHDTFVNDSDPNKERFRFRIQGVAHNFSENNTSKAFLTYDWISDKNMPGNFKSDDFELNTAKRTRLQMRHFGEQALLGLNLEPRINTFQNVKQELPQIRVAVHPVEIGSTGLFTENIFKAGFLDYAYANRTDDFVPDFHAVRLESNNAIYRTFTPSIFSITPEIGFIGIFYSEDTKSDPNLQAIGKYGGNIHTTLKKPYQNITHTIEPYIDFLGLTTPTTNIDDTFIFSIQDGYSRINMFTFGIKNFLHKGSSIGTKPTFDSNLYGYSFLGSTSFSKQIPKVGLDLQWNLASLLFYAKLGWNFQEDLLDFSNFLFEYTFNENAAISVEFRHRGRYQFRKDQKENFILDVKRPLDVLVNSPLSDNRNVVLTKIQLRVSPKWILRGVTHHGWGRSDEPAYNEAKIDLIGTLSSFWKMRMSYSLKVTPDNHPFSKQFEFQLFAKGY